jgi:hypothetical protein
MDVNSDAKLLRIFISSTDKFKHTPLYEAIIYAAKRYGISGATVLRGIMGYGASSIVHSMKFWELTEKMPLIIELADTSEKIEKFTETILPYFELTKNGGLITIENIQIVIHKKGLKSRF